MKDMGDVIIKPVISEKSYSLVEQNRYTFVVNPKSNKTEIKKAIEEIYNVKVLSVNTLKIPKKLRRLGKSMGYKPGYKKAIVTLRQGDSIQIFEGT
jgi:large subunit ribosomal protein L23